MTGELDVAGLAEVARAADEFNDGRGWHYYEGLRYERAPQVRVDDYPDAEPEVVCEADLVDAAYIAAANPAAVLALLDRLAAAESAVERVAAILAAWDAWDGSKGPDGRGHPDASSPYDRERLRAALDRGDGSAS